MEGIGWFDAGGSPDVCEALGGFAGEGDRRNCGRLEESAIFGGGKDVGVTLRKDEDFAENEMAGDEGGLAPA